MQLDISEKYFEENEYIYALKTEDLLVTLKYCR